MVKLLVDKGASVNAVDAEGETPLSRASFIGHIEIIKLLIDKGVNINKVDNRIGQTPLIKFVKSQDKLSLIDLTNLEIKEKRLAMVREFLNRGAGVNTQDNAGDTALGCAAYLRQDDTCKLLLEHKANPKICNWFGQTPCNLAQKRCDNELAKILSNAEAQVS